jgi:hypothetical protein
MAAKPCAHVVAHCLAPGSQSDWVTRSSQSPWCGELNAFRHDVQRPAPEHVSCGYRDKVWFSDVQLFTAPVAALILAQVLADSHSANSTTGSKNRE